jgi:atlastin
MGAQVPPDMKISVVSVVGAFRTGKSFLLDLFLR